MSSNNPISNFQDVPWKQRFYRSMLGYGIHFSRRSDGTINRFILNLFDLKARPSKQPIDGVITSDTVVDATRNLYFRLFLPSLEQKTNMPLIVYFHGGGFAYMSANSIGCDDLCRNLCKKTGAVIISVNYRLSPEHKYPSQYDDGFDVLKFIDDNANTKNFPSNVNLKQCFIAGDSAGGNLAHHVTVKACEYGLRNVKLIGLIAIQPFFGGEERTESENRLVDAPVLSVKGTDWLWKTFLPEGSDRDHPACNVFGPKSVYDIRRLKFPATMVVVGGVDPLYDWQIRYYEGLKKCGKEAYLIEYPNAFHSFYGAPELKESGLLMEEVKDFIGKLIK